MDNILEVTGLVKRYPSFTLDNISFSLPEGCVTGFIGANGAGKDDDDTLYSGSCAQKTRA